MESKEEKHFGHHVMDVAALAQKKVGVTGPALAAVGYYFASNAGYPAVDSGLQYIQDKTQTPIISTNTGRKIRHADCSSSPPAGQAETKAGELSSAQRNGEIAIGGVGLILLGGARILTRRPKKDNENGNEPQR